MSLGGFLEKLRDFWWHRVRVDDQPRGLYNLMTRGRLRRRRRALRAHLPRRAGHGLPDAVPRPAVAGGDEEGKPGAGGDELAQRQGGADAAAPLRGGPVRPHRARRARRRLLGDHQDLGPRADRARRSTGGPTGCARSTPAIRGRGGRGPVRPGPRPPAPVVLDDLVGGDREAALAGLLGFCGVGGRRHRAPSSTARWGRAQAHRGRWAEGWARSSGRACAASTSAPWPRSPTRATTSPARCSTPTSGSDERSRPGAGRILFVSSNGTGLGHLTRSMAIARRLERLEPLFLTLSGAAPVVREQGFPVEYVASYRPRAPAATGAGRGACAAGCGRRSPRPRPTCSSSTAPIPTRG